MQAIIMAGGEGSRLRPLTCNTPKPMMKLCGKPILEYILEWLSLHHVTSATVTLGYLPHIIEEYFSEGKYGDIDLKFVRETTPLGTAGGVKHGLPAAEEDFLVVSGDALSDFDLSAAMQAHRLSNSAITLIATPVADPREYGLVNCDENGRVIGFNEKPSWRGVTTNLANTGIYIIRPDILELIPDDRPFDFAKDLFPLMLEKHITIGTYVDNGYWCDIGDLESYRRCQTDLLNHKVKHISVPIHPTTQKDYQIISPSYIGAGVRIGNGAIIGPNAVIEEGCEIGDYARIRSSVLLSDCYVGKNSRVTCGVLSQGVSVGKHVSIYEGVVLGEGATVEDYSEILPHVLVWPHKTVAEYVRLKSNLKVGEVLGEFFDDAGICGTVGIQITPEFCARLGCAIGSIDGVDRIGIAYEQGNETKAMYHAVLSGLCSTGVQVWDFGPLNGAQMQLASSLCRLSLSVYLKRDDACVIEILDSYGLPCSDETERKIKSILNRDLFVRCSGENYRDIADLRHFKLVYQQELERFYPNGLSGVSACIQAEGKEDDRYLKDLLVRAGGIAKKLPLFDLSKDGRCLRCIDENGNEYSSFATTALGCRMLSRQSPVIAMPIDTPISLIKLIQSNGSDCLIYGRKNDRSARQLAREQGWLRDGAMLALCILSYMKEHHLTLSQCMKEVTVGTVCEGEIPIVCGPSEVMEQIKEFTKLTDGGALYESKSGIVRIWPAKNGKRIKLLAEAANFEVAQELCGELQGKIADILDTE